MCFTCLPSILRDQKMPEGGMVLQDLHGRGADAAS